MKLIIQIPAFNEAETLAETVADLPKKIDGIDAIEYLLIDDGSSDGTSDVARELGIHHIIRQKRNRGLARGFQSGLDRALSEGADIIVNTDADNQYNGHDIEKLVRPIINGEAELVIGDRGVRDNRNFGPFKRLLQVFGSFVVRRFSQTDITDAVSGFRAISRDAAMQIQIVTGFSYTTEMLIQAGRKKIAMTSVPIRTNYVERPSRLFKSIPRFIANTGGTILRSYAMYYPLRLFLMIGAILSVLGMLPILRFIYFYIIGEGQGHVQSLIIGGTILILGVITGLMGILGDLVGRNRQLLESVLYRSKVLEAEIQALNKENAP